MNQIIVKDYPPLFDEIDAVFRVRGKDVFYAWGDRIFNPNGLIIPPELLAHEAIHGQRQGTNEQSIIDWWKRYIHEPSFRLAEEIPAHQAEYQYLMEHGNNRARRAALKETASRLASPLYGRMITPKRAKKLLVTEAY